MNPQCVHTYRHTHVHTYIQLFIHNLHSGGKCSQKHHTTWKILSTAFGAKENNSTASILWSTLSDRIWIFDGKNNLPWEHIGFQLIQLLSNKNFKLKPKKKHTDLKTSIILLRHIKNLGTIWWLVVNARWIGRKSVIHWWDKNSHYSLGHDLRKGKEKLSLLISQRQQVPKRQAVSKAGNLLCTIPGSNVSKNVAEAFLPDFTFLFLKFKISF